MPLANDTVLSRGTAGFFGAFFLLNGLVRQARPDFDGAIWCLDLRWMPPAVANGFVLVLGLTLLLVAFDRISRQWNRRAAALLIGSALAIALMDCATYWRLLAAGHIHSRVPVPATLLWAGALGLCLVPLFREGCHGEGALPATAPSGTSLPDRSTGRPAWPMGLAVAGLWAAVFPLVQVGCFGTTDYRRRADVAVVFGARVYASGALSQAVGDRVDTAVGLYQSGLVPQLLLSGGPGDGAIHETEAMRRRAMECGVPSSAILVDPLGLNTAATVRNTVRQLSGRRVLAVSEFYHLPRIKLAYAASALEVYTVPAVPSHWRRRWALGSIGREVPAFWAYYARVVGQSFAR